MFKTIEKKPSLDVNVINRNVSDRGTVARSKQHLVNCYWMFQFVFFSLLVFINKIQVRHWHVHHSDNWDVERGCACVCVCVEIENAEFPWHYFTHLFFIIYISTACNNMTRYGNNIRISNCSLNDTRCFYRLIKSQKWKKSIRNSNFLFSIFILFSVSR